MLMINFLYNIILYQDFLFEEYNLREWSVGKLHEKNRLI